MNLLIIDSGHAELVAGKESPDKKFREWKFNHSMQNKLNDRAKDHDIHVYLTNPNPSKINEIGLSKRSDLANQYYKSKGKPKTLFLSLHANAYGKDFNSARGTETFIANNASKSSKDAASYIQKEVFKTFKSLDSKSLDRGVKVENFSVIYNTITPAVLVEYGFYTNREDLKILENNQDELIESTIKAVCLYFGIQYKPKTAVNNTKWAVCVGAFNDRRLADECLAESKKKGFKDSYIIPR